VALYNKKQLSIIKSLEKKPEVNGKPIIESVAIIT